MVDLSAVSADELQAELAKRNAGGTSRAPRPAWLTQYTTDELKRELSWRGDAEEVPSSTPPTLAIQLNDPPGINCPIRLDLGCGKAKKPGFTGVDSIAFEGVDVVCDLAQSRWPWADNSVEEAHCSHMLEHIPAKQRAHFFNELYRVLKLDAKATIITPHWCSNRAYGDLTHEWPPVSEMFYWYLSAKWRAENAPHQDFWTCNFDTFQPAYSPHPGLQFKAQEFRDLALMFAKEAAQDLICTVIKRAP